MQKILKGHTVVTLAVQPEKRGNRTDFLNCLKSASVDLEKIIDAATIDETIKTAARNYIDKVDAKLKKAKSEAFEEMKRAILASPLALPGQEWWEVID